MNSIFEYQNYVSYLKAYSGNKARSGFWSKLAVAAEVNSAFISQVTTRKRDLNLEQAERVTRFLKLTTLESEFFLLLVERERAGTRELKFYFDKKITELLEKTQSNIKTRLDNFGELSQLEQAIYYSHWLYGAVHIALTIPRLRAVQALSEELGIDQNLVAEAIEFLMKVGLATFTEGKYFPTQKLVHLSRTSKLIRQHHVNWRSKALAAVDQMKDDNLHYSVVVSLSEKDFSRFRSRLMELVKEFMANIKDSPEEELAAFAFDFFKMSAK